MSNVDVISECALLSRSWLQPINSKKVKPTTTINISAKRKGPRCSVSFNGISSVLVTILNNCVTRSLQLDKGENTLCSDNNPLLLW